MLTVNTDINARMVVIDKTEGESSQVRATAAAGPVATGQWVSDGVFAEVIEAAVNDFAHNPPVFVRDTECNVLGATASNSSNGTSSGMVYDGKTHLFRDGIRD